MRAVVQRVSRGEVRVAGDTVGVIDRGFVVLLGVVASDTADIAAKLAAKIAQLRIFPDDAKPMNRSVVDVGGAVLVVSQFTLVADTSRGNRPSFTTAAPPAHANAIYDAFVSAMRTQVAHVACGEFGADMQVELVNDGPVTFVLDAS